MYYWRFNHLPNYYNCLWLKMKKKHLSNSKSMQFIQLPFTELHNQLASETVWNLLFTESHNAWTKSDAFKKYYELITNTKRLSTLTGQLHQCWKPKGTQTHNIFSNYYQMIMEKIKLRAKTSWKLDHIQYCCNLLQGEMN